MTTEFKLPEIGEGIAEGEIVKWMVAEGDVVAEDDPLVEVMTDKATVEIPSPRAGTIVKLAAREGEVVDVGTVILVFGDEGDEVGSEAQDDSQQLDDSPEMDAEGSGDDAAIETAAEEVDKSPANADSSSSGFDWGPGGDAKKKVNEEAATSIRTDATDSVEDARAAARAELEAAEEVPVARLNGHSGAAVKPWEIATLSTPGNGGSGRLLASSATRRLAREVGVDLRELIGTGPDGRIRKEDVEAFAATRTAIMQGGATVSATLAESGPVSSSAAADPGAVVDVSAASEASTPASAPPVVPPPIPTAASAPAPAADAATSDTEPEEEEELSWRPVAERPDPPSVAPIANTAEGVRNDEERIPFRGLRRRIAERMVHSKTVVPHFTYVEEADMSEVIALRQQAKLLGAEEGIRVTYLPFIIRALVTALRQHPIVNSTLDEEAGEIVVKRHFNVGIATATARGLIVPVVKHAERLGVFELAREIQRLADSARDGRSSIEDLQEGTITITSTGNIGGVLATPIVNHPEVAIIGVTAIRKRAVVVDDEIVVRPMLNLSMSLDHRVVDGADGALFMRDLIRYLEDPRLQPLGSL